MFSTGLTLILQVEPNHISVNGADFSTPSGLIYGVPQGSVLGPSLFILYIVPQCEIISRFFIDFHFYADDNQLIFPINQSNEQNAILNAESCLAAIKDWMVFNKLKLNDTKTEILRCSRNANIVTNCDVVNVSGCRISIGTGPVRNLGVMFDDRLSMNEHVTKTIQTCNYHIRRIGRIRNLLDTDTTKTIVTSFILSILDYCNSLLAGCSSGLIDRLQMLQNKAARLVSLSRKREHITPVLEDLHWLPMKYRITFKINLITFNCLNNLAPSYLQELVEPYKPCRDLRSSNANLLKVPNFKLKFSEKAFSILAPKLWNSLSIETRNCEDRDTFKKRLKTELFTQAFYD